MEVSRFLRAAAEDRGNGQQKRRFKRGLAEWDEWEGAFELI